MYRCFFGGSTCSNVNTQLLFFAKVLILFIFNMAANLTQDIPSEEKYDKNGMPIAIKDDGVVELVKEDAAMIFYITVKNIGHDPLELSVNSTRCCQKFSAEDEDCESMRLFGGDMGKLYPQDTRNLTLIYPTLHIHDRVGSCDMVISSSDGKKVERVVKFNTTLPRGSNVRIPRLLERYYDHEDMVNCEYLDQDPLKLCQRVSCLIKYTGHRNYFNYTSNKCEKLPACISSKKDSADVAYVSEKNSCQELKTELTEEEKAEFHEGRPGAHELKHPHRYPMNLLCHQGKLDADGTSCICNKGWSSAPYDPASFNFDVQIYHMCTVWKGELTAKEAANLTFVTKEDHRDFNYILFAVLGCAFIVVACILGICVYLRSRKPKVSAIDDEENSLKLMQDDEDDDDDETEETE